MVSYLEWPPACRIPDRRPLRSRFLSPKTIFVTSPWVERARSVELVFVMHYRGEALEHRVFSFI